MADPSWRQHGWPNDRPVFRHPDLPSPQPDTAPDGPWTKRGTAWTCLLEHPDGTRLNPVSGRIGETSEQVVERVAAALNGAPATPAERAVIDAAEAWGLARERNLASPARNPLALVDASVDLSSAVARLRSERNKNDG